MDSHVVPQPTSLTKIKKKKSKVKLEKIILPYGDPDLSVLVRLLPPGLAESEFISQVQEKAASINVKKIVFTAGRSTKSAFEEPAHSYAQLWFFSKTNADTFKSTFKDATFEDSKTGEKLSCSVERPVYGSVYPESKDGPLGPISADPHFTEFMAQHEAKAENIDLLEIAADISKEKQKASQAQKKKKAKEVKNLAADSPKSENATTDAPALETLQPKSTKSKTLKKKSKAKRSAESITPSKLLPSPSDPKIPHPGESKGKLDNELPLKTKKIKNKNRDPKAVVNPAKEALKPKKGTKPPAAGGLPQQS